MDATSDLFADQADGGRVRGASPVFFAISPDVGAAVHAERTARLLRARNELTGAPRAPETLHVSLLGIGRCPALRPDVVGKACAAAAAITMPPFEVAFDRAASFGGGPEWPLVLFGGDGVIGVEMLQSELISELEKAGIRFKKNSYEPHMTVLRDRRRVMAQSIPPVRWRVREFALIHSLHGHTKHVRLARWPLSGQ
jgi:2'-5' RNA ligase